MDTGANDYRRFLGGDEGGFAAIVETYTDSLTMYLYSVVGDIHLAEDLTEDTFFKLLVRKPRYTPRASFKTWLYTIGRHTAIDSMRKRRETPQEDLSEPAALLSAEQEYFGNERDRLLRRVMKTLPSNYEEVLFLTYFEELTVSETAAVLHLSSRQTSILLYRAKAALRTALEKEGITRENFA